MSIATKNHKTWVEVSKKALQNNAEIVLGLIGPETKLMAVVKSNAYGHGLVETAKILADPHLVAEPLSGSATKYECFEVEPLNIPEVQPLGADWFGTDNVDEAILLRESGIKNPILVLGFTSLDRFSEAIKHQIRLTFYDNLSTSQVNKSKLAMSKWPCLHLKVDTGMSRQGVLVADLSKFIKSIPRGLPIEGIYTHLANADNLEDRAYPNLQLANFKKALEVLRQHGINPPIKHALASAGLFTFSTPHLFRPSATRKAESQSLKGAGFNMVRIGIALYGLWPSVEFKNKFKNLKTEPALSWKTRIVQIKKIKKGTPVGYGITERVKKDSPIAVLPVGYYDGYMRALSGVGEVLISGKRCKILGRISMNLSVVDVSKCPEAKVGGEVVLIGTQGRDRITAEELAEKANTISYEIVARINPLLPRVVVG